jgi:hypothetical protein
MFCVDGHPDSQQEEKNYRWKQRTHQCNTAYSWSSNQPKKSAENTVRFCWPSTGTQWELRTYISADQATISTGTGMGISHDQHIS